MRQIAQSGKPGGLALLAQWGNASDLQVALEKGANSPQVLSALLETARVHKKKPSGNVAAVLSTILKENDPATKPLAIALIGAWEIKSLTDFVAAELRTRNTSEPALLAAIQALPALEGTASSLPLLKTYATIDQTTAIRTQAIQSLTRIDPSRAAAVTYALLPDLSDTQDITPIIAALIHGPERGTKLAELITNKPLDRETLTKLLQELALTGQPRSPLETAIQNALGIPNAVPTKYDAEYVKNLKGLVETSGNAEYGKLAYQKAATCVACHKIDGTGGDIGPDLSEVGVGCSLELLIESVLWPNRQIREGYMTTKITTKDDQLHVGYRLAEQSGVLHLRDIASASVKKIARTNIKHEEEAGSSMIPGLTAALTEAELAHLIAYLAALKKE